MNRLRTLPAVLAAAAMLLTGCSSDDQPDLGPVGDRVDALDSAQADLRGRIRDLETALATLATGGEETDTPATGLIDQLNSLQEAIDALDTMVDQEILDRGDADTDLQNLISGVQDLLADLDRDLADLTATVQALREDHELLVARFERHLSDHS